MSSRKPRARTLHVYRPGGDAHGTAGSLMTLKEAASSHARKEPEWEVSYDRSRNAESRRNNHRGRKIKTTIKPIAKPAQPAASMTCHPSFRGTLPTHPLVPNMVLPRPEATRFSNAAGIERALAENWAGSLCGFCAGTPSKPGRIGRTALPEKAISTWLLSLRFVPADYVWLTVNHRVGGSSPSSGAKLPVSKNGEFG